MFQRLFGSARSANQAIVEALYGSIVAAARQPVLYAVYATPDTPLGRFEMVGLHVFLLLDRLRDEPAPAPDVAQDLTDRFFADMESSLRELGIGDLGVPKRMKKLARMFYGRTLSYSRALRESDRAGLADALARNIRPGSARDAAADALAAYVVAAEQHLASQAAGRLTSGAVEFPHPAELGAAR